MKGRIYVSLPSTRERIALELSSIEARLLFRLVGYGVLRLIGHSFDPSESLSALMADGPATVRALRSIATRLEKELGCPECGQLDAHAARCSLRHPDRD